MRLPKLVKGLLLFVGFLFFTISFSYSQEINEKDVPQQITEHFKAKHPNTYVYKWKRKKKTGDYEAKYYLKGQEYKSYYTASGDWIRSEREVKRENVPQEVWVHIAKSSYYSWKVDDIEEHATPEYPILYEIEVELKANNTKREVYLYYLPSGELVKEVVKK